MVFIKTAMAGFTLCFIAVSPIHAHSTDNSTTAGLRIQLDQQGNRVTPGSKGAPAAAPVATPVPATAEVPASGAAPARSTLTAPAPEGPQVVKAGGGVGTVVRLNGMFRAGSRANIGPDGKLSGDCHIDSGEQEAAN